MPTFLQLAPEQGGNRFGPFNGGAIQLGSDQKKCQIFLGMPGIAPIHATVMDHGNGAYTVAPSQRGLGLLLMQNGQLRPLDQPAQARVGDTIYVGGHNGARFTLQFDGPGGNRGAGVALGGMAPAAAAVQSQSHMPNVGGRYAKQGGFGNAMANELQRQAFGRLLAKTPLRDYYSLIYRFRSGSALQPRYIISAVGALVFLFGGSLVSCTGIVAAWFGFHH
jgi:hypothetical protein